MEKKIKIPEKYLPFGAFPIISVLLETVDLNIKIAGSRSSKYGDFNPCLHKKQAPTISINNNLNPYSFLITFLHEFAHYLVWKEKHFYAKPHGKTWKKHFSSLMQTTMDKGIFPDTILKALEKHIINPRASSCIDTGLFKVLANFDKEKSGVFIDDISDGLLFQSSNGQYFRREKKIRKRILCVCLKNKKKYLFSPIHKVFPVENQQYI
ncbi:MAG: SprT family zinc-dependent metalloprotease [Bacteroidetes bacterium]|nr:SprT family zinc-dependent metalloprotease [Bacteroidota bacterium]